MNFGFDLKKIYIHFNIPKKLMEIKCLCSLKMSKMNNVNYLNKSVQFVTIWLLFYFFGTVDNKLQLFKMEIAAAKTCNTAIVAPAVYIS